jgi:hypothetical protein
MSSLFGTRIVDRAVSSEVTIKIIEPFGSLKAGDSFHFTVPTQSIQSWGVILEVSTGKVIAVDQDGRPAMVTNTIGTGKTLLSAYQIEHCLAGVPAAFDQPENTHRLYDAFREWVGINPPLSLRPAGSRSLCAECRPPRLLGCCESLRAAARCSDSFERAGQFL